jgi:hypothetical protein
MLLPSAPAFPVSSRFDGKRCPASAPLRPKLPADPGGTSGAAAPHTSGTEAELTQQSPPGWPAGFVMGAVGGSIVPPACWAVRGSLWTAHLPARRSICVRNNIPSSNPFLVGVPTAQRHCWRAEFSPRAGVSAPGLPQSRVLIYTVDVTCATDFPEKSKPVDKFPENAVLSHAQDHLDRNPRLVAEARFGVVAGVPPLRGGRVPPAGPVLHCHHLPCAKAEGVRTVAAAGVGCRGPFTPPEGRTLRVSGPAKISSAENG